MSTRATRSRAAKSGEEAQKLVKDYFKTTRKPRTRETQSRTRNRTPTRQALPQDLSGTPPKRAREEPAPVLEEKEKSIVLDNGTVSALDSLMNAAAAQKKKKTIRTVADLQARLAEKGASKAIHEQNLKNKGKKVEEHAEVLKSPVKKVISDGPIPKSKAVRSLLKDTAVPDYVLPNANSFKSPEKLLEEADSKFEAEAKKRTEEFLKTSKLIEKVKESVKSNIELPKSYEFLANAFQHVDRIVSIINSQHRSCVAPELFKNIKNTLQRDFCSRHLSQILHVYPQSYQVEMREQWKAFGGVQAGKYELEVRPNLVDDLKGFIKQEIHSTTNDEEIPLVKPGKLMASPIKSPRKNMAQPALRKAEIDGRIRLDAARMRDRSHIFRHKLTEVVRNHHCQFLKSQGIEPSDDIIRFHPLFQADKHCPPLEQKPLPEPPIVKNNKHIGMREYMDANLEPKEVELPSIVQKALDDLKSPVKKVTSGSVPLSPKKFAEMQAEQKSKGAMSLLERIRAREACKKAAENCIDENLKIRKSRLSLLDSRYLRTLCSLYAAKKAQSMELDIVADKLVFSSTIPTSRLDVITHLELLCSIAPAYMSEATVMNKRYLRITDNNYDAIAEIVREQLSSAKSATEQQAKQIEIAQKAAMMNSSSNQHQQKQLAPRPFSPKASKAARSLKFM
ncbi:unnamed protein product [Caenorhabditis angaria]|uniref:CDT1 Geminin-binding domain-containing protein n=1 Tax=Caenorhabditis angaria TaxID=860376 RepID=A0A9P1I5U7_9PELO|nr:unnamed protein product [Caenorhabditis angaria]